ncbi:tetratricopeptide repeat protein [Desulfatiferula olefinivorans]
MLAVVLMSALCGPVAAAEPAADFLDGVKRYNEGRFEDAARLFESVADKGVVNGALYYNAGNAWFKAGDIGRAMLWYERALVRMPHDPDLIYNHAYVSGLLRDKIDDRPSPIVTVLFFWKDLLGARIIRILALVLFAAFWVLRVVDMLRSGRSVRGVQWVVLGLALVFILTASADYYRARFHPRGTVLADTVSVRSGLSDDSTELFVLHSGTRVEVDDERRGYVKIRFSADKIGWVKKEFIEII